MSADLRKLESDLLALPAPQRALLAHKLIVSLDPSFEAEFERDWLEEARRRDQEITEGKVSCRTADEVIRDAYRRIGCFR
jgi:hypothetical protein